MKNKDNTNLEQVYESINNKEKQLISEDANETIGSSILWLYVIGLPLVLNYFSKKYPSLTEAFNKIKNDLTQETIKNEIKNILIKAKQQPQPQQKPDGISSLLSGGVRKQPTNFKG